MGKGRKFTNKFGKPDLPRTNHHEQTSKICSFTLDLEIPSIVLGARPSKSEKHAWVCGRGLTRKTIIEWDTLRESTVWEYTTFKSADGKMRRFSSFPHESIEEAYRMNEEFDLRSVCRDPGSSTQQKWRL